MTLDTTAIAAIPTLTALEGALKTVEAQLAAAFPSANLGNAFTLLNGFVAEVAALANPDPTVAAKIRDDAKAVLAKAGHFFGTVARAAADAVDPAQKAAPSAPSAPAQTAPTK